MNELMKKVIDLVADSFNRDADGIKPESDLINDLGGDSLDHVEMAFSFEEKFKIDISDQELEKIRTVQDIYDLVKKKAPQHV